MIHNINDVKLNFLRETFLRSKAALLIDGVDERNMKITSECWSALARHDIAWKFEGKRRGQTEA